MAGPSLQASTTQISWIYTNCTWSIIILSRTLSCTAVHTHTQAHQSWSRETSQHNGYDLTARRQARWRALQLDTRIVSQPRPFLFHTTDHFQYAASGGRVWRLRTTLHAHSFAKLMFQGKIHTALQLLTDKSKGGILHLHDTINNGESNQITFKGALKCLEMPTPPWPGSNPWLHLPGHALGSQSCYLQSNWCILDLVHCSEHKVHQNLI